MMTLNSLAIWFCILPVLATLNTVSCKATRKIAEERRVRALRPTFVKRDSQAPLLHAGDEKIDDEYMVKLRDDLTDDELVKFEEKFQELSEEHGIHVDFQMNVTILMKGFVARIPGDAVDILRWLDEVEFVEEDEVVHGADISWGLDRIDQTDLPLDDAFVRGTYGDRDGLGVNVFVVDSGIHFTHREFEDRAHQFLDLVGDGRDGDDCVGHGTTVAGVVGGLNVGVATNVMLYSCRILDCQNNGLASRSIAAMEEIAGSNMKPAVVNLSYGGLKSTMENLLVKRLTDAGYHVVAAAGNKRVDACTISPASAPEAITVAATESDDGLASFSNYGSCVDILAPGKRILTSSNLDDISYSYVGGTSVAAPHVAGVLALILGYKPSLSRSMAEKVLMDAVATDKIDLSSLPANSGTPNKLLQLPSDFLDLLCQNRCPYLDNGECDDGSTDSTSSRCFYGFDCNDCGPRVPVKRNIRHTNFHDCKLNDCSLAN